MLLRRAEVEHGSVERLQVIGIDLGTADSYATSLFSICTNRGGFWVFEQLQLAEVAYIRGGAIEVVQNEAWLPYHGQGCKILSMLYDTGTSFTLQTSWKDPDGACFMLSQFWHCTI